MLGEVRQGMDGEELEIESDANQGRAMKAKKKPRSNRVASDDGLAKAPYTLPRCYQRRRYIIAADDDALVCIECGGRNRRVHVVVG